MYKVKFTPYRSDLGSIFHRQTEHHNCMSRDGKYRFYINEDIEDPDFWVVQGKGVHKEETCHVAPSNTIVLATEPQSVLIYPQSYLRQFGMVCTCQENTNHPHVHLGPAILPWFVGYQKSPDGKLEYTADYDSLKSLSTPNKQKLLSVITSNKAFTRGHLERIRFVERLKAHYGDKIDVFGRGFNEFADKWDVLAPYKYHIAIENSSQRYYWTEKISDCYLTNTFPFYFGCTNLEDYFPKGSFLRIDIKNFAQTIDTIDAAIATSTFEHSLDLINECRLKVLNEFNMFEYVARLCDTLNPEAPKEFVTIKPCHSMQNWHNFWRYTLGRTYYKLEYKIGNNLRGGTLLKNE